MKKIKVIKQIKSRIKEVSQEPFSSKEVKSAMKKVEHESFREEEVSTTQRRAPIIRNTETAPLERTTQISVSDIGDKGTSREFSYVARNVTTDDNSSQKQYGPAESAVANRSAANVLRSNPSLTREQRVFQNNVLDERVVRNDSVSERNYNQPSEKKRKRMPWE